MWALVIFEIPIMIDLVFTTFKVSYSTVNKQTIQNSQAYLEEWMSEILKTTCFIFIWASTLNWTKFQLFHMWALINSTVSISVIYQLCPWWHMPGRYSDPVWTCFDRYLSGLLVHNQGDSSGRQKTDGTNVRSAKAEVNSRRQSYFLTLGSHAWIPECTVTYSNTAVQTS